MSYVLIVDDSECMGETDFEGTFTPLDTAKMAVEQFFVSIKQAPTHDKTNFMLLHTGPARSCILSLYGEPFSVFENQLENIEIAYIER